MSVINITEKGGVYFGITEKKCQVGVNKLGMVGEKYLQEHVRWPSLDKKEGGNSRKKSKRISGNLLVTRIQVLIWQWG